MYTVKLSRQAVRDREKLMGAKLSKKAKTIIDVLKINPFQNPPPYEKLVGDLKGYYSRRINLQHRLVYEVMQDEKIVVIRSMWTHYE